MWRPYLELPRAIYVLCLGTLINRAGTLLAPFLTLYLRESRNLTIEFAGWAVGAFGLGSIVAALIGGHLADTIGRRVVMLVSLLGGAGLMALFGRLTSPAGIIAGVTAIGFLGEMYRPACSAMIADLVAAERRPQAYGLMYIAINLGFAIAPVIGGWMAHRSFQWLFWGDALTSAAYALIILAAVAETMPQRAGGKGASGMAAGGASWGLIARDGTFVVLCVGALLAGMVIFQCMSTLPLYLGQLGIGPEQYGRIIALNGLLIVVLQIPVTAVIQRCHRGTMLVLALVVTAVGFGATGLVTTAWGFAGTVVVWTIGELMQAPLMPAVVSDLAPVHLRATYMGVFSMSFSGGRALGAPLGGIVLSRWGGGWLWSGCVVVCLVAAAMYRMISQRLAVRSGPVRGG